MQGPPTDHLPRLKTRCVFGLPSLRPADFLVRYKLVTASFGLGHVSISTSIENLIICRPADGKSLGSTRYVLSLGSLSSANDKIPSPNTAIPKCAVGCFVAPYLLRWQFRQSSCSEDRQTDRDPSPARIADRIEVDPTVALT